MPKNTPSAPSVPGAPGVPGNPAGPGGSAVTPCPNCNITSQTAVSVPSNRARTDLGVGESVDVTFSLGAATWTFSPNEGMLSSTSGSTVTYTAPDRASTVIITATGGGCSCSITFHIIEPSGIRMVRQPGTQRKHTFHRASTGFIADIYFLPETVSFEHCSYVESDVDAVGTGCFQQYFANNSVGHHPNPNPISVGPPTSDTSGSKVNGFDRISCDADKCDGGWTWSIPWSFQVGGGLSKEFTTVDQVIAITAAGRATISKAGASASSEFNDPTEVDPLF